jgi:tetratricopeptide (TPR) repeat protein
MAGMIRWILSLLFVFSTWIATVPAAAAQDVALPNITEEQWQQAEDISQKAIAATQKGEFAAAEAYWTELIADFASNPAVWSNRGNSRVSQNKLDEAIADYNRAIELAPDAAAPYLNRGAVLEAQGHYEAAIADYNRVLALNPTDAMALNNRGNAEGGLKNWEAAISDYQKAAELDPNFAFARANVALALYETGQKAAALKAIQDLVRKYPMFPDMRAALTAVLWERGQQGEAESNWVATVGMDNRYQDLAWVKQVRRWPPQMIAALDKFLSLK